MSSERANLSESTNTAERAMAEESAKDRERATK